MDGSGERSSPAAVSARCDIPTVPMPSPPRFFQDSEEDYAKRLVAWLIDKGYINVDFTDPRLSYFTAQIDADLLPAQHDGSITERTDG